MKDELELCRFCEGEAMIISLFPTPPHGRTFVQCKSCQATGPVGTREQAIAAWNARPIPQAGDAGELVERLENMPLADRLNTVSLHNEAATTITELVSALEKARTFIDTEPALNDHNCPGAGCKKCKRRLDAFSDVNTALSNVRGKE